MLRRGLRTVAPAAALALAGCIGGSDDNADSEVFEEVGELVTVAGAGATTVEEISLFLDSSPMDVSFGGASVLAAGPSGQLWVMIGGSVFNVSGPVVDLDSTLAAATYPSDLDVGSDGTLYVTDYSSFDGEGRLLQSRDGQVTNLPSDDVTSYSHAAVGPDGTVFVTSPRAILDEPGTNDMVAIEPDETVRTVVETEVGRPVAVDSDGTVYYVREGVESAPRVMALRADGTEETINGGGLRELVDGGRAEATGLYGHHIEEIAVSGDIVYFLSGNPESQDVWRIEDGVLHLELRRSVHDPEILDMAVSPDGQVYVLESPGRVSRIE